MATSNTYTFGSSSFDTLLKTSLQLCGITPGEVDGWKVQMAIQSANMILSDWANRGNNLWLSQTLMMPIIPSQQTYLLPQQVTYIKELQAVQLTQVTNSAGGAGAFIGSPINPTYIGRDYGAGAQVSITYASFTPFLTQTCSLDLQYSFTGNVIAPAATDWQSAYSQPWTSTPTQYQAGQTVYFVPTAPVGAKAWRFIDLSSNTDISTATVQFYNQSNSRLLVSLSENDFYSIPMPQQQSTSVSSYYLDRQMQPTINLWPVPDDTYDAFVYKAMTTAQDAGALINQGQVPQRFLRTLTYEIAAELALQFAPDRFPVLSQLATELHDRAAIEDRERVPLRITPNFVSYT